MTTTTQAPRYRVGTRTEIEEPGFDLGPYNGFKCKRCRLTAIGYGADCCPRCGCKTLWLDEVKP